MNLSLPPGTISGSVTITVTGGDEGDEVTIDVWDDEGHTGTVVITLGPGGEGTGVWTVPSDWGASANFKGTNNSTNQEYRPVQ